MTEDQIRKILEQYKSGDMSPNEAVERLRNLPFEDLGFANVDHHRTLRQGFPEVIFGAGKSAHQVAKIVQAMLAGRDNILVTRANREQYDRVLEVAPPAKFHEAARVIEVRQDDTMRGKGTVL